MKNKINPTLSYITCTIRLYVVFCVVITTFNAGTILHRHYRDILGVVMVHDEVRITMPPDDYISPATQSDAVYRVKAPSMTMRNLRKQMGNAEMLPEELPHNN